MPECCRPAVGPPNERAVRLPQRVVRGTRGQVCAVRRPGHVVELAAAEAGVQGRLEVPSARQISACCAQGILERADRQARSIDGPIQGRRCRRLPASTPTGLPSGFQVGTVPSRRRAGQRLAVRRPGQVEHAAGVVLEDRSGRAVGGPEPDPVRAGKRGWRSRAIAARVLAIRRPGQVDDTAGKPPRTVAATGCAALWRRADRSRRRGGRPAGRGRVPAG